MHGISLEFAMSSLCLVCLSLVSQDGSERAVEGEAWGPLVDNSWNPVDNPHSEMTLLVINSIKTSSNNFSVVLSSSDIQAWVSLSWL
jgi:hypothetical protein